MRLGLYLIFPMLLDESFDGHPPLGIVVVLLSCLTVDGWMDGGGLVAFSRLSQAVTTLFLMSLDVSFPLSIVDLCALHLGTTVAWRGFNQCCSLFLKMSYWIGLLN